MIKKFDKVGILVVLLLALGLFMGAECDEDEEEPAVPAYPPFSFEVDGEGWIPLSGGITTCEHSADQYQLGKHSLKCVCALDGTVAGIAAGKREGHVRKTLDAVVDFTGLTLSGHVYIPTSVIDSSGTNTMALFVQDENDAWGSVPYVKISTWTGIVENQWCEISGTITGAADITKIKHVGLQVSMSTITADTYAGSIYLDNVDWK